MRPDSSQRAQRLAAPAFVVSLVVMAPVLLAADGVSATTSRPVVLVSQDRADALVRCVSEAARQFVPVAIVVPVEPGRAFTHPAPVLWTVHTPADPFTADLIAHLPSLIDLPPPLR